jgi:DNA polymerase I
VIDVSTVTLNLVDDFDEAQNFMRWLGERRSVLAVDTETGGLQWWRDPLRLVQFGDGQTGWAIPWEEWSGLVKEAFRRLDGSTPIAMHNAPFDVRYLERNGCRLNRSVCHDTRVMAHLVDPINPTGLKPLGVRYVDPQLAHLQSDLKGDFARNGWTWASVPFDFGPYWTYGALDTVITANLFEHLRPLVREYERAYELEIASQLVLCDVVTRGIRIDVAYCETKYAELLEYVDSMTSYIAETYNGCGVSNRAIAAQFLRDGIDLIETTPTGEWQMTSEILEGIDHPLAADILARKRAQKIASAYFRNMIEQSDGDVLHPDINPIGARTGRMSISNPAVQQIPRGRVVRDAFIAREGNKLVDIDYDQVEQRLNAHFTADENMIAAFADVDENGGDFFTNIARQIYGDETIQKSDPRRQTAKNVSYAKAYGAGLDKVALMAGISEAEAASFLAMYDSTFPGVRRFMSTVEQTARQRLTDEGEAYVKTAWGRRLPADDGQLYALVNYLIQGTASDLLKQKLVDLDSAGLAQYIVLPVHDELLFDVPEEDVEEVAPALVEVMRETEAFAVPLTCAAEIGNTWGEVH